jgi:hypothetical protein
LDSPTAYVVKLGFIGEIVTQLFKVFARLFQKAAQVLGRGAPRRSSQRAELSLMRRESEAEPQSRVATREIPYFLEHNA